MTIAECIELMKRDGLRLAKPIPVHGMPDMVFSFSFHPDGVPTTELTILCPECPQDMAEFWGLARSAKLFADATYGQWGLEILDPAQSVEKTRRCLSRRGKDFNTEDLVVGEFLGDAELLVVRCDKSADDFGSVLVALPIDPRSQWYNIAESFCDFLNRFIDVGGDKYWITNLG